VEVCLAAGRRGEQQRQGQDDPAEPQ